MSDYCDYIDCNCKYCEEGQCDFPVQGSGYPYDAPCFRYEKEDDEGDKLKVPDFPFTEDQFHRTTNNLRITVNRLTRRNNNSLTPEDKSRLYSDFCAVDTMATMLYMRFFVQFNHKPSARRICPNPDCHHIYAFFFDDWEYCPQCGTKLIKTVYEEE